MIRTIWEFLTGRRVSRLDETLAAALYRGIKHDEAMERRTREAAAGRAQREQRRRAATRIP